MNIHFQKVFEYQRKRCCFITYTSDKYSFYKCVPFPFKLHDVSYFIYIKCKLQQEESERVHRSC